MVTVTNQCALSASLELEVAEEPSLFGAAGPGHAAMFLCSDGHG
jgi:hypothetical protein